MRLKKSSYVFARQLLSSESRSLATFPSTSKLSSERTRLSLLGHLRSSACKAELWVIHESTQHREKCREIIGGAAGPAGAPLSPSPAASACLVRRRQRPIYADRGGLLTVDSVRGCASARRHLYAQEIKAELPCFRHSSVEFGLRRTRRRPVPY